MSESRFPPEALDAAGRVFAQIMAERHPGTAWRPVKRSELNPSTTAGEIVGRFPEPEDVRPFPDSDVGLADAA